MPSASSSWVAFRTRAVDLVQASAASLPHRVFLTVAIPFGLALILLTPPFEVPDEPLHYFRAFAISLGRWGAIPVGDSTGNLLPVSVNESAARLTTNMGKPEKANVSLIRSELSRPLAKDVQTPVAFAASAVYFPLVYAPQAAGIWASTVLGGSPLHALYAGRLTNMVVAILLVWLAIRLMPVHRWVMTLVAISPMAAFTRSSLSADALTLALALLFVALVVRAALVRTDRLRPGEFAAIVVVAVLLGLCKFSYFVFSAAVLIVPTVRFRSVWHRLGVATAAVIATSIPTLGWTAHAAPLYRPQPPGRSSSGQLQHMLHHPFQVLGGWAETAWTNAGFYLETAVGKFGWLDTPLPGWVITTLATLFVAAAILDASLEHALTALQKLVAVSVAFAGVAAVFAALYVAWTPVGATFVDGVQGRYLLPVVPLVALPLLNKLTARREASFALLAVVGVFALLSVSATAATLYGRYFS